MTTDKQKNTVAFIERWLHVKYTGHIECYDAVSYFIGLYLKQAQEKAHQYQLDRLFSNK